MFHVPITSLVCNARIRWNKCLSASRQISSTDISMQYKEHERRSIYLDGPRCVRWTILASRCTNEMHMIPVVVCMSAAEIARTWESLDYFEFCIQVSANWVCQVAAISWLVSQALTLKVYSGADTIYYSVTYRYICHWSYSSTKVCSRYHSLPSTWPTRRTIQNPMACEKYPRGRTWGNSKELFTQDPSLYKAHALHSQCSAFHNIEA
jgi:hypothetical protein